MIAVIVTICAVLSAVAAVGALLYNRRDRSTDKSKKETAEHITNAVNNALFPLEKRLILIEDYPNKSLMTMKGLLMEYSDPIKERLISVEARLAQVEVMWKILSTALADYLHRPDPARAEVDRLLEGFKHKTLNEIEWSTLRKHLITISKWEPGQPSEYPILESEPGFAAILLVIMDNMLSPGSLTK